MELMYELLKSIAACTHVNIPILRTEFFDTSASSFCDRK
jgi:hypothetical protein